MELGGDRRRALDLECAAPVQLEQQLEAGNVAFNVYQVVVCD